jgi:hypothetical protein
MNKINSISKLITGIRLTDNVGPLGVDMLIQYWRKGRTNINTKLILTYKNKIYF